MESLERILMEHPFFADIDPKHMGLIASCASNVRFAAGEHLFHEGGAADKFFLIREGKVALEVPQPRGNRIPIQTVCEGDVVGWSWLIPPHQWRFDARAVEPVRAFALDGVCLRGKCEQDHDLGYMFLTRVAHLTAQRLHATRMQLLEVYSAWHLLTDGQS